MLPDICDRLKQQFGRKYAKVVLLPNAVVARNNLDDDGATCFFQVITALECAPRPLASRTQPLCRFLDEKEAGERVTLFEKKNNVGQFIYESPFTLDGKARASPSVPFIFH